MEFLDTQIISYKYKNNTELFDGDICGRHISSIVALEFLGIMVKGENKATMYPTKLRGLHAALPFIGRSKKIPPLFGKNHTDRLIIDFNGEFDSIVVYSNEAISYLINNKELDTLLFFAKASLDKEDYRKFRERAQFLIDSNITVVPITPDIVSRMQHIYEDIKHEYNVKGNYRNSFMDLLIVATAVENKRKLISNDKELNKVLDRNCDYLNVTTYPSGLTSVAFCQEERSNIPSKGKRGYINNSWQVMVRNKII